MTADQLFDDTPYIDASKVRRRRITKPKPKPEPTAVTIGDGWVVFANERGVHRLRNEAAGGSGLCGATGAVLTVPSGTVAGACAKCLAAMDE